MRDRCSTRISLADLYTNWLVHERLGHRIDRLRKRSTKAPNVAALWGLLEDFLNVVPESHVEHFVGLIKNNVLEVVKQNLTLAVQVEKATWGCHQNIHALFHGRDLGAHRGSAVHGKHAKAGFGRVLLHLSRNLHAEFAGRS